MVDVDSVRLRGNRVWRLPSGARAGKNANRAQRTEICKEFPPGYQQRIRQTVVV